MDFALFSESFFEMLKAMWQIFFIAIIAGLLVRKGIFKDEYIKGLSSFIINILLPALIFSNTIQNFSPETQKMWWLLPIAGFVLSVFSVILSAFFFVKTFNANKDVLPVAAFQNSGYLILPIGQIIFKEQFEEFALYVFLFIIGFNVVLWSVGKYFLSNKQEKKISIKELLTAPLVANIFSVLIVLFGAKHFIPDFIVQPISFIGSATVPVATFVLGATLGSISVRSFPRWHVIFRAVSIKLLLIPAIVFVILFFSPLRNKNSLMCNLLLLEAAAPTAANVIVMVRNFGGDRQKIGSLMFSSYIFSIFTLPMWIALWEWLTAIA